MQRQYAGDLTIIKKERPVNLMNEVDHIALYRQRARAWIKRRSEVTKSVEWKPRKIFRKAAYEALCTQDHQLRLGTSYGGLAFFAQPSDPAKRGPAIEWPHLGRAEDLGSDQLCGYNFGCHKLYMNWDLTPDACHGVHRNVSNALDKADLMRHEQVMLISHNVAHTPYGQDERYWKAVGSTEELLEELAPTDVPYFEEELPGILRDCDEQHRITEEGILGTMWQKWKDGGSCLRKKYRKICTSRFMCVKEGRKMDKQFHERKV